MSAGNDVPQPDPDGGIDLTAAEFAEWMDGARGEARADVELTEAERERLMDVWDEETTVSAGAFFPVVARIVAERLRGVEAQLRGGRTAAGELRGQLRVVEAERDHWKKVAEQRGETMNEALAQSQQMLERAMDADRALAEARQRQDRVRALAAAADADIAKVNAEADPLTGRHSTMVGFVLTSDLARALDGGDDA